jgi:hypothetical protein
MACSVAASLIFSFSALFVKMTGGRVPALEVTAARSVLSFLITLLLALRKVGAAGSEAKATCVIYQCRAAAVQAQAQAAVPGLSHRGCRGWPQGEGCRCMLLPPSPECGAAALRSQPSSW